MVNRINGTKSVSCIIKCKYVDKLLKQINIQSSYHIYHIIILYHIQYIKYINAVGLCGLCQEVNKSVTHLLVLCM